MKVDYQLFKPNFSHVFVGGRVGIEGVVIVSGNVVSESHDTPFVSVTGEVR